MLHFNLGVSLFNSGAKDKALQVLQKARQLDPENRQIKDFLHQITNQAASSAKELFEQAVARHQRGELGKAIELYKQTLDLEPDNSKALSNMGYALFATGRLDAALACCRQAVAIKPDYGQAHNNLGNVLRGLGRLDEAEAAYKKAIASQPELAEAHDNLGCIHHERGLMDAAMQCHQKAIAIKPDFAQAYNNLGVVLQTQSRLDEAAAHYERAIELNPHHAEANYNLGLILLVQGKWRQGLALYEWRWKRDESVFHGHEEPLWDGSDPTGKTILIHCEQGLGDAIHFIRYAGLLDKKGADVVVLCPATMQSILSNVAGIHQLSTDVKQIPPCDFQIPLLSLPYLFDTTPDTIPAPIPYIHADPTKAERYRREMAALPGFKVGIVWRGNPQHKNDRNRSMDPALAAKLFTVTRCSFVGLQKDPKAEELELLSGYGNFFDFSAKLQDFSDTAAIMAGLDLIISVDTAVLHLGGAMGRPVWGLLINTPDWRWLLDGEHSPWYPSLRLFRQPAHGDWETVIHLLGKELAQTIADSESK